MLNSKFHRRHFILSGLAAGPSLYAPFIANSSNSVIKSSLFKINGDGTESDFLRFQSAIIYASQNNSTLFLEKEITVNVSSEISITCSIIGSNSQMICVGPASKINITNKNTHLIKVSGLTFNGNSFSSGVNLVDSQKIEVSNCKFINFVKTELFIDNTRSVKVSNSFFGSQKKNPLNTSCIQVKDSVLLDFESNTLFSDSLVGLLVENCSKLNFLTNKIYMTSDSKKELSSFLNLKDIFETKIESNTFYSTSKVDNSLRPSIHVLLKPEITLSSPVVLNNQFKYGQVFEYSKIRSLI